MADVRRRRLGIGQRIVSSLFFSLNQKKKRFSLGALSGRDIWSLNNWLSLPRTSRRETLPRSFGSTAFRFSLVLFCLVFVRSLVSYLVALVCALLSGNKRNVLTGPTVPLPAIKKKRAKKRKQKLKKKKKKKTKTKEMGEGKGRRAPSWRRQKTAILYIIYSLLSDWSIIEMVTCAVLLCHSSARCLFIDSVVYLHGIWSRFACLCKRFPVLYPFFPQILPSFTGFYLVLLGFTGFTGVLPSFTGYLFTLTYLNLVLPIFA